MSSQAFNIDCMEGMAKYPDGYFELAIVDPPYGINRDGQKQFISKKNPQHNRKHFASKGWDAATPNAEYFAELFRVSKNQIIWGGNYFTLYLPSTKGWVFWYKGQNDLTMSDGELAWTSLDTVTRQVTFNRNELLREGTIHPTQKPIKLYRWLLQRFAKAGDKILDTHLGSGSSRIAAHEAGHEFIGFELDKDYFDAQEKRFAKYLSQGVLELA